jgi:hypothetical protein
MQLLIYATVSGVSLCPSPEASYYGPLIIMAFGESGLVSTGHQGPVFSEFAADNAITVGV